MKAFQNKIDDSIKKLQYLAKLYSGKDYWVVESDNHVNVGESHGLNGTSFAVKSPLSCTCVSIWETKEKAEQYGADYYLVDGRDKPIYMRFTKAYDFFIREAENAKDLLVFIKERTNNNNNQEG